MPSPPLSPLDLFNVRAALSEDERLVQDAVARMVDEKILPIIGGAFEEHRFPRELVPELAAMGLLGAIPALQQLGLDMNKWKSAMDSGSHKPEVDADAKAGGDVGIQGTPAFLINGYFINGAQPFAKFRKVIDRALAEAK